MKRIRNILVLSCTLMMLILFNSAKSEEISPLLGSSAEKFIELIEIETANPQSLLYGASSTNIFMMDNNWYWGIIGPDDSYYFTFLLSGNEKDAIILSGKALIRRDSCIDNSLSFELVHTKAWDLGTEIYRAANEAATQKYGYGFPVDIVQYCSLNYLTCKYFFFDPQQYKSPRIDSIGNDIQGFIYTFRQETMGELESNIGILFPSIKQEQIQIIDSDSIVVPNTDTLIVKKLPRSNKITDATYSIAENTYLIDYNNQISIQIVCDSIDEEVKRIEVYSSLMGERDLFRDYMDIFYKISKIPKNDVITNLLSFFYGEEFVWENMMSHTRTYNRLQIESPTFYIDGWAVRFSYDLSGIPCMRIYNGTINKPNFSEIFNGYY